MDDVSGRAIARHRAAPGRRLRPGAGALLITLIVVLLAWRVESDRRAEADARPAGMPASTRTAAGVSIEVPSGWVSLQRAAGHATWGSRDRRHTVTVGTLDASVLPLPGVVETAVDAALGSIPGARQAERARSLELARAPRDDAAVAVRYLVEAPEGEARPLHVVQVWRRDSAAARDLVATWTSADGSWPLDPERAIPQPGVR